MLEPAGCGVAQTSGYGYYQASFNIQNLANIAWPVTVTLLNTGGISNAGNPVAVTLAANATTNSGNITFDADPHNNLLTATIQISICWIVVGTLTYPMFPIITISALTLHSSNPAYGEFANGANKFWQFQPVFTLIAGACELGVSGGSGSQFVVTAVDVATGNPLLVWSPTYGFPSPAYSYVFQTYQQICIQAQSTARQVLVTIQPVFGNLFASPPYGVNLSPAFQTTVTVPAA